MPYQESNFCEKPDKIDQKIWRLIDSKKYVDLLNRRALYFARTDRLGDELEGQKTTPEVLLTEKQRKEWAERIHLNPQFLEYINKLDSVTDKDLLQNIFVNCWYMYDEDSKAMWDLFPNKDIAIQSIYLKLRDSIKDPRDVFIGKVVYRDLGNDINPMDNYFRRLIRKDKQFENEKELRAIVNNWVENGQIFKKPLDEGIYVSVDIELLVERVFVSPSSSLEFVESIQFITEKSGLPRKVQKSNANS